MKYVYFENWSLPIFISQLTDKGLPNEGTIIKVFASDYDPRMLVDKPGLAVLAVSSEPLTDLYVYPERGITITGAQMEADIAGLGVGEKARETIRTLVRFGSDPSIDSTAAGMRLTWGDRWLIQHPLENIDGIDAARTNPDRVMSIHLDLFVPATLRKLREVMDYTTAEHTFSPMEGRFIRESLNNISRTKPEMR